MPTLRRDQIAAGNFSSRLDRQLIQAAGLFVGCLRTQPGSDDHKFVSAHAGDIIVAAADLFQMARQNSFSRLSPSRWP